MIRKALILLAVLIVGLMIFLGARTVFTHLALGDKGITLGVVRHESPHALGDFSFFDEKGQIHTLAEWQGQIVILNLWGTWCPPCREEMPALGRLQSDLAGESIIVLTINLDRLGQRPPALWLQEAGLENLPAFHGQSQAILGATNTSVVPTTLILDRQSRERARITGAANWDSKRLRMLIAYYANQKE